ncbi:MAG: hypothetical protein PHP42_08590 [Bacteroidota bacterium]|nr:hypothetical protein [Bacteroidota bacterium]
MYETLLNETEKFLEKRKEKQLPVLEVWDAMVETAERLKFEMPESIGDFECLVEADKRFAFINNKMNEEVAELDAGEEEGEYEVGEDYFEVEEMEKIGFNQNQMLALKKNVKKSSQDEDDTPSFAPRLGTEKNHVKKNAVKSAASSKHKVAQKKKQNTKRKK